MRIYAEIPSIYVAGIEEVKAGIALTRNCFHEQNIAQNSGITGKPRSFHMQTDEIGPPRVERDKSHSPVVNTLSLSICPRHLSQQAHEELTIK